MATKIGRGCVSAKGQRLDLLMVLGGKKRVEWCEQRGGNVVLKTGTPEKMKGDVVQVRDPEAFDRTVYIPVTQLDGATFLIKR